jgi:hypothetical protein
MKVNARIIQEADNMSKTVHMPFRDCLEILLRADATSVTSIESLDSWESLRVLVART